ncbi:MAG: apolipoprotein N-acyltransferase [Planctomycetes bacterium]|nr:apolipoprotein N-acyltransferase [Planctomycetota bacterium]
MAIGTPRMETAITTQPKPAPASAPQQLDSSQKGAWLCLAAAATSALLLWMCSQPLSMGTYLGWVALAPFLVLVRTQTQGLPATADRLTRTWRHLKGLGWLSSVVTFLFSSPSFPYTCALLFGLLFFVPSLSWMSVADKSMVAAWLTLSVYCGLYFVAALYAIRCLDAWRLPLIVSAPLVWVALEYTRCWALTGFPWYLLAHTQHDFLPMIQIADLGGVFLISFVVVAVNAFLFDCAYQFPEVRRWFAQSELDPAQTFSSVETLNRDVLARFYFRRNLIIEGVVLVILLISTYSYGTYRLGQNQFRPGPTVCLLQSNLDQRLRESNEDRDTKRVTEQFASLCVRGSFNHIPKPDLLIWPETSFPRHFVDVSKDLPIERVPAIWRDETINVQKALSDLSGKYTRIPHLLGVNAHVLDAEGKHRRYNSAILLKPVVHANGEVKGRVEGKFDKVHRVPFGEFLPLGDWLPFLIWLTPYEGDFGIHAGEKLTRFELGKHRFGVLICYEDTDPFLARRYLEATDTEPAVDFLVNMSNDGWFDGSVEHEEHLAVCRFRAIECRRTMVRAVNMGVSAVIDPNGRVLKPKDAGNKPPEPPVWIITEDPLSHPELPVSEWHKYKKTHGILKAIVPIDTRFSFYAAVGDWLGLGCSLVLVGFAAWALVRWRWAGATP